MLNVLCLKHGKKYSAEYVNRLYRAVQRNLTLPHKFICFTEDPAGIDPGVFVIDLPKSSHFTGWWWKPYLFKQGHFHNNDTNLFFDLDMVVVRNIDALALFSPGKFMGMRDVFRVIRPKVHKLGSAVMRWQANEHSDIYDKLDKYPKYMKQFRGDQDWIWYLSKSDIMFYPDEWIKSYKWEIRSKSDLRKVGCSWQFTNVASPTVPVDTMVLAFHGTPDVHDCRDPVILQHWR